ncbi:hypothetical protein HG15A2_32180 [Adhaeretor mobilis]|uniref:Uncharacterized protein n=1 Tax=Adhaeretor mobilis TaxID=1930276 RepID=A0A517MYJ1_9BACT|nr:hypothetical protein HG15A2_32180 [Adhaeretor mobilis]
MEISYEIAIRIHPLGPVQSSQTMHGFTDLDFGGYFHLEPLELVEKLNKDIEIEEHAPGLLAFASDGGGASSYSMISAKYTRCR